MAERLVPALATWVPAALAGATFSIAPPPWAVFELVFLYDALSPELSTGPAPLN